MSRGGATIVPKLNSSPALFKTLEVMRILTAQEECLQIPDGDSKRSEAPIKVSQWYLNRDLVTLASFLRNYD